MLKENLNKAEVVERLGRARRGEALPFLDYAKAIVDGGKLVTDEDLLTMKRGIEAIDGTQRRFGEPRIVVSGEPALLADVVVIWGAERGLWDAVGYELEFVPERKFDDDYSEAIVRTIRRLWESSHPLFVALITDLKYGIRKTNDAALSVVWQVTQTSWLNWKERNEVSVWRLETLKMAAGAVLIDRGYDLDQLQSDSEYV